MSNRHDQAVRAAQAIRDDASSAVTSTQAEPTTPSSSLERGLSIGKGVAVIALSIFAGLWFLSWARPILVPIVAAILIGMILGPIADRAKRFGIPGFVTNLVVLAGLALAAYAIAALFIPTIADWIAHAPERMAEVREKVGFLQRIAAQIQEFEKLFSGSDGQPTVQVDQPSAVTTVLAAVTPAFAELFVFVFTLALFMLGRSSIKQTLILAVHGRENRLTALRILTDVEARLLDHFAIVTLINLGVAVLTTLMLMALGVPSAPVWGFLAFVLNFLPVIGPLILKVILLGMGIVVMPTLTTALLPVLGYLLITVIESNLVTPKIIGHRLTVEPLLIFVTVCFLTWLWGPVGALLSMPVLSVAVIVTEHLWPADEVTLPG